MNKKIIILFTILVLFMVAIVFILLLPKSAPPPVDSPQRPSPTSSTKRSVLPSPTPLPNQLIVKSLLPVQNPTDPYLNFQKITLEFNDEVSPEELILEITPVTAVDIIGGQSPEILLIIPKDTWSDGETSITVLQTTNSISGKRMVSPFSFTLLTAPVSFSPEELELDYP